METKICTQCGEEKELYEFHKDRYNSDRLTSACKICRRKQIKVFRQKQKIENPWYSSYRGAKERCNNPKHDYYHRYGGRGIKFLLTKEECVFIWFRDKAWELESPSIDRIDNDGDYTFDNCRYIEMVENVKKSHIDNPQGKPVLQFDLDGNFIKEWNSIKEASNFINRNTTTLTGCCCGFQKTSAGFIWKYKHE